MPDTEAEARERGPAQPSEAEPEPAKPSPTPSGPTRAIASLRLESTHAADEGEIDRAIELLERALRIDPRRGELWLDLGRLHLEAGRADEAEQMARKALTLSTDAPRLEQRAWSLIDRVEATRD